MNRSRVSNDIDKVSDDRWRFVVTRDKSADGSFVYCVKTTGIYCRPSCGARLARPENVEFYDNGIEAENAGYRPCKRCCPRDETARDSKIIAEACRILTQAEYFPGLDKLASQAELSKYHFHRLFKRKTGLTVKEFFDGCRKERVKSNLLDAASITEAIAEAGFAASSRFYAMSDDLIGMTPSQYRNGGMRCDIRFAVGQCSLGSILVAQTPQGVCAIALGDDPQPLVDDLQKRFPLAKLLGGDEKFEQVVALVVGFVEQPQIGLDLPLDIRGTVFQHRVWQILREIPVGTTVTYKEIAELLGQPNAVRAVASACAANALAVAIPCHRVVRTDGGISGYRWGVERKRALLKREATCAPSVDSDARADEC